MNQPQLESRFQDIGKTMSEEHSHVPKHGAQIFNNFDVVVPTGFEPVSEP